jgi:nucleotide-binding universal stress UspA family protein
MGTNARATSRAQPGIRDVLAYCTNFRRWSTGVHYAAALASALRASLTGLYAGARLPSVKPTPGTTPWQAEWAAHATDEIHCAMLASRTFSEWAQAQGVSRAYWQVALGDPRDVLDAAGNTSDLLVLERHEDGSELPALLHPVLLSGLACVVVPPTPYVSGRFERIVIAWDSSPAATRALHAAIPLLHGAGEVILLCAGGRPEETVATHVQPPFDPQVHLRNHGVASRTETLSAAGGQAAHALLASAARHRADLLVIGAHGKPRRSASHLGDTTHVMLQQAQMPLFMRY